MIHAKVFCGLKCANGTWQIILWFHSFIHSFIFHFIHLQVQPKDVEIVIKCCTMYLLNYRCQITEYNYNAMIT
jgi:hypothetical protein